MTEKPIPCFLVAYSDSSFTNPHEVVRPDEPPECAGNFTHMGAKYWGFETARHKATTLIEGDDSFRFDHNAYHWLHLGLETAAQVSKVTISTKWFTGNQVPEVAVELVHGHVTIEVLPRTPLAPDQEHEFSIEPTLASECLVRCFHEGGIARINLFGSLETQPTDQINLLESATISHVSNEHYGRPADAVAGHRQVDYMFGWESARTGFGESALFHLPSPAVIESIIVDTYLHRLNAPLSCHVFAVFEEDVDKIDHHMSLRPAWTIEFEDGLKVRPESFQTYMQEQLYLGEPVEKPEVFTVRLENDQPQLWHPLVSFGRLRPDTWHRFQEIEFSGAVTHLLYMHYPNGGIHGLKVFGRHA